MFEVKEPRFSHAQRRRRQITRLLRSEDGEPPHREHEQHPRVRLLQTGRLPSCAGTLAPGVHRQEL